MNGLGRHLAVEGKVVLKFNIEKLDRLLGCSAHTRMHTDLDTQFKAKDHQSSHTETLCLPLRLQEDSQSSQDNTAPWFCRAAVDSNNVDTEMIEIAQKRAKIMEKNTRRIYCYVIAEP